jgi:hypothetical protein
MMADTQPCIAYYDDGTRCREPATRLDHQRGGMVCSRRFVWEEDNAEGVTFPQADVTVIPMGDSEDEDEP